jgi:hypothetical protein
MEPARCKGGRGMEAEKGFLYIYMGHVLEFQIGWVYVEYLRRQHMRRRGSNILRKAEIYQATRHQYVGFSPSLLPQSFGATRLFILSHLSASGYRDFRGFSFIFNRQRPPSTDLPPPDICLDYTS